MLVYQRVPTNSIWWFSIVAMHLCQITRGYLVHWNLGIYQAHPPMDWVMPNPDIRIWVLDYPRRLTDELTTSDLHNFLSICENQRWSMESSVKLNSLWGWLTRFHENGGLIILFLVNHPHDCCTKSQCFMMNLQSFADVLRSFGHQAPPLDYFRIVTGVLFHRRG